MHITLKSSNLKTCNLIHVPTFLYLPQKFIDREGLQLWEKIRAVYTTDIFSRVTIYIKNFLVYIWIIPRQTERAISRAENITHLKSRKYYTFKICGKNCLLSFRHFSILHISKLGKSYTYNVKLLIRKNRTSIQIFKNFKPF